MSAVVSFENTSYAVGGRTILSALKLAVETGETVVLLGRSGSGKTTALKLVNALLTPTQGAVNVMGRATAAWDVVALRRGIGYVIQESGLFPHYTVAQNVALVPRLLGQPAPAIEERVRELLQSVGLPYNDYAQRLPRQLSGGQRQRVGVARALAADPPLLLFDEPFGALDPVTRLELQTLFLDLKRRLRKTALFVTHDIREALLLGDRIVLLQDGQIVASGTPADFQRAAHPEARAFLAALEPVA